MDTVFDIPTATIVEHFHVLEDPRIERTKLHLLIDIITLTVCAVICGADGPVDIEQYGHEKFDWLQTFLVLQDLPWVPLDIGVALQTRMVQN